VWGLTKVLITIANTNSNNPTLTNSTYPLPHTFSPTLVSHILPIATPAYPHFTKCLYRHGTLGAL